MAQNKINHMHNTEEVLVSFAWEKIVSAHVAATVKKWKPIGIIFTFILLISCLPNVLLTSTPMCSTDN